MVTIRIRPEDWGPVWRALVAAGPVSRVSEELVYLVSDDQVLMLRQKKLPFEVVEVNPPEPSPPELSDGLAQIYGVLSRRYRSGHDDTADRHNEHQP